MTSAGLPTGPDIADWVPPASVTDRLDRLESGRVIPAIEYDVTPSASGATNRIGLQAAINDAITDGATIEMPPGIFTFDTTVTAGIDTSNRNPPVRITGTGAAGSLFHGSFPVPVSPTTFRRVNAADTFPIIKAFGYGLNLENFALDGQYGIGPLLQIDFGFEARLRNLRAYRSGAQGLILNGLSNARIDDVHVDNCGSATTPAVRIGTQTAPAFASNTLYFKNLHIERSTGVDLDIASGTGAGDYAEFLMFDGLHIEGITDNSTLPDYKTQELIRLGNARHVALVNAFLYSSKGGCIVQNAETASTGNKYSTHIANSYLLGNSAAAGKPNRLIDLVGGTASDSFSMVGSKLDWASTEYIRIQAGYLGNVEIGPNNYERSRAGTTSVIVNDERATRTPVGIDFDFAPKGRYLSTDIAKPTMTAGANNGTTAPTPLIPGTSNHTRGQITFGSGTGPAVGQQAVATFTRTYQAAPFVFLAPRNAAAAALQPYVGASTTAFAIYTGVAPAASQANTTYDFNYWIIG